MTNSKIKGKRGELEAAAALRAVLGAVARRGQQFAGGAESPDLVTDLAGVHFEVKRTERLRLYEAIDQAVEESGGNLPIVLHRANRRPWLAILRLDDLPQLAKLLTERLP